MEINWNDVISNVLQAVLIFILPPLAVAVVQWVKAKAERLLAEARQWNPTVTDFIQRAAMFAVAAAEQAGAAELIQDKKKYALAVAQRWLLANAQINIDMSLVEAAIEKAVREMNDSLIPAGG